MSAHYLYVGTPGRLLNAIGNVPRHGGRGPGVGGSELTETYVLPLRGRRVHLHVPFLHAVHPLLDSPIELLKLYGTVQKRVDGVQSRSVQMYSTATSSGSCDEAGPEKAVVAAQPCRCCCNVTTWCQYRLSELPSHPRRAPLRTSSTF